MHKSILNNFTKYVDLDNLMINNTTENINIMMIASVFFTNHETIFVVLPSLFKAQNYYDKLVRVVNEEQVLFYPADEMVVSEMLMASIEFRLERINTIKNLLSNKTYIVVTNINGILKKQLSVNCWQKAVIQITKNEEIQRNSLIQKLIFLGYKRSYTISSIGEFSVRGSIIDIFPISSINPIRLDLFDNVVEKMKYFDINTQRSNEEIDSMDILPTHEMFYDDIEKQLALKELESFILKNKPSVLELELFNKDKERIENREDLDALMKYVSFFGGNQSIIQFAKKQRTYYVDTPNIDNAYEKIKSSIKEYALAYKGNAITKLEYFNPLDYHNDYQINQGNNPMGRDTINYQGHTKLIIDDLKDYQNKKQCIITFLDNKRLDEFKELLLEHHLGYQMIKNEINEMGIYLVVDNKALDFDLYQDNFLCLTEENLYPRYEAKKSIKYKSVFGEAKRVKTVEELIIGDFVVHYDQGIGQYLGIETMDLTGIKRDYIKIMYANDDKFYVPIEQISLVGKYMSSEGSNPKLTKLGSASWEKAKQNVKNKIKDISQKLIALYAQREQAIGYSFLKDTPSQSEFEEDFEYEETIDQMRAINDMKRDMESLRPMDRLVCGDVGYGKTEIAMRGAFKAIMSGKQVAYLAPTTVLVRQHLNTFINRFAKFGANVKMLNRFVSITEQHKILEDLAKGSVDIVIGTHRLLSKDIVFKDLGFLIIDEEQRFGVEHKERIKELKVNVDTITLTATPIPRTLQMSLLGIKDLSMIETPPQNRYPIQTYVLERNETIIKEAIEREMARGGQVFYLYNRVNSIEQAVNKIQKLIPEAKITYAHGQMNKDDLEDKIASFIDKKFDVLVCTTIIETGIDIPNTNTLIIHDASVLGLSQLYQIRGRVGRSDKIAYSYLMYDRGKILTEDAKKRLQVIKDFTELGSGFKIAMRDLSIRGAGDLLGSDQSGFIDSVGLDLYMKILEDAIHNKNDLGVKPDNEVYASRYIDKYYINDDAIRIDIHKRIDKINSIKDLDDLKSELEDRFGSYHIDLDLYMYERLFKNLCQKMEITNVKKQKNKIELIFTTEASDLLNGEKMFLSADDRYYRFAYLDNRVHIILSTQHLDKHWLIEIVEYLMRIN